MFTNIRCSIAILKNKASNLSMYFISSMAFFFLSHLIFFSSLTSKLDPKLQEKSKQIINGAKNMAPVPRKYNRGVRLSLNAHVIPSVLTSAVERSNN